MEKLFFILSLQFLLFKLQLQRVSVYSSALFLIFISLIARSIVIDRTDLKNLLQQSAKYKDCTRIVLSKGPIPMRFRRGVKDEFPCIIDMN